MNRFPEGFRDPVRLPESFGGEAWRGRWDDAPVVLLALSLGTDAAARTEFCATAARRWEALAPQCSALLRPYRWFLEGPVFFQAFHDPGGRLFSEVLLEAETWQTAREALLPFLDQWEALTGQGATLGVLDPARLLWGPRGLQSFDLLHVVDLTPEPALWSPPFATVDDLLVLSPEMTRRTALPVDLRSGLFSLGVILYRAAAGRWPLQKSDPLEMVHALLNQTPDLTLPELARSGPVFLAILQKLLEKNPRDRYQTLRGLKWDLGQRGLPLVQAFVPGSHDRLLPIADIRRVYGRRAETESLAAVLARVKSNQSATLVVRGAGGQGKSRLVEDLKRQAEPEGMLWLQGKFDQYDPRFSAGALVQVLEQWVDLNAGPSAQVIEAIRAQLGRNLRILVTLLPALAPFLGPTPELVVLSHEEGQQRFLHTLVSLFGLLAEIQPVVLAVEDVHWADELSLRLLEALALARLPRLALVGTCRPDGLDDSKGFLSVVKGVPGPGQGLLDLGPLDEADLRDLLADCTELTPVDQTQLARLLHRFSAGNPFSIRVLLREVNLRQAVVFDDAEGRWKLHPDRLRDLPFDQALNLVVERVKNLPPDVRTALLTASLLGIQFLKSEVLTSGLISSQRFDQVLEELLEMGVWERLGPSEYRFSHDKIQQAVYELVDEQERAQAHLRVGRDRLQRWRDGRPLAAAAMAVHLNRGFDLLTDEEKRELVLLNHRAGEEARQNSDMGGALVFLEAAIRQGGAELWSSQPEGAWTLYKAAAEVAYTELRRDWADAWSDEAVRRSAGALRRAQIRERQQNYLFYLGDPEASIRAGMLGLKELGISIPAKPGLAHVLGALIGVKVALFGKTPETLARQSLNEDETSRTAMLLLSGFIPPAFLSGRQNLFGLAVLKATRMTIRDGLCAESAPSYTGYAVLLAALGDLKGSYDFGRFAVELNQRFDDLTWRSMVLTLTGLFSLGWFEPWDRLKPRFQAARQAAEESGDVLYRTYAYLFATEWNPEDDLPQRLERTDEALALILKNRYPLTRVSAQFVLGQLRNLEGSAQPRLSFATPDFDPEAGMEEHRRSQSNSGLEVCYQEMLKAAFLLGDLDMAKTNMLWAESLRSAIAGSLYEEELTLFSGLVNADLVRRGERPSQKRLKSCRRQAQRWARGSSMFHLHAHLLRAEELDLAGRTIAAQQAFLASVTAADNAGFLLYRALTRERAALFFSRHGFEGPARQYKDESLDAWRRYGAWAKVPSAHAPVVKTASAPTGDVDLVSLMRALEAISREIRLEPLTHTITKLILESSGAERVVLLLPLGGQFLLEGEATAQGFVPGAKRPLATLADVPQSFVHQAVQSRQPLVIEEVTESHRRKEPQLTARGVKALICLPLVSPDGLKALVYLENTVMAGILTSERIRMVELLSSTIGVALQNAQLFQEVRQVNESLEKRVEERTRELRASQKKIILQEKLASLGALTAGIAHELKNPLNIINNFSESSIELLGELVTVLDPLREGFPESVKADLDYLLPELVQNMRDIKVHGDRGDGIIRSMLMHSRSAAENAATEDLNALVRESLGLSFHGIRASKKDFQCETELNLDERIPPVHMIRANLGRVLINLCNNAFQAVWEQQRKSRSDYAPKVSLTTQWLGDGVRVVVEDNGPGIPADLQDKIFQPFFTTKPSGEGTGLGLSISFEIIQEEFGGTIDVQSEPSKFTRFVLHLPLAGHAGVKE